METIELILPSHWACAIVNGDYSGLSPEDEQDIEETLEGEHVGHCLDVSEEEFFTWSHDGPTSYGANCLEYTFELID